MLTSQEQQIDEADLPVKTKEQLKEYLGERDVPREQFDKILNRVISEYQYTRIEACEAVGIIAAQSIGEPVTQMTMRTFVSLGRWELPAPISLAVSPGNGCGLGPERAVAFGLLWCGRRVRRSR